jgi:hypothetical protein
LTGSKKGQKGRIVSYNKDEARWLVDWGTDGGGPSLYKQKNLMDEWTRQRRCDAKNKEWVPGLAVRKARNRRDGQHIGRIIDWCSDTGRWLVDWGAGGGGQRFCKQDFLVEGSHTVEIKLQRAGTEQLRAPICDSIGKIYLQPNATTAKLLREIESLLGLDCFDLQSIPPTVGVRRGDYHGFRRFKMRRGDLAQLCSEYLEETSVMSFNIQR